MVLAVCLCILVPAHAMGDGSGVTLGAGVDANRAFLWRGLEIDRGLLVQPSAWASNRGWSAELWGNLVADEVDPEADRGLTEIDGIITRQAGLAGMSLEASLTGYYFPKQAGSSTAELGLCLSHGLGPVGIRASGALDVAEHAGGLYGEIGIDWERDLGGPASISAGASQGLATAKFNRSYLGLDRASLGPLKLSAGLSLQLAGSVKLRPHAEWYRAMDRDVAGLVPDDQFNIGLAVEFGE